jgi:hypothetical protein
MDQEKTDLKLKQQGPWHFVGIHQGGGFYFEEPQKIVYQLKEAHPELPKLVTEVLILQFMKKVNREENKLKDWPRRSSDGGNSELDPTSKSSVESIYEGNRKYHVADKMYGIIPIFKEIGVDCDVLNQYIDWCKNAWPNIDFETLKIENCIIDDENSNNIILIEANENWKYLDNGSNQGTAWRGTNFMILLGTQEKLS